MTNFKISTIWLLLFQICLPIYCQYSCLAYLKHFNDHQLWIENATNFKPYTQIGVVPLMNEYVFALRACLCSGSTLLNVVTCFNNLDIWTPDRPALVHNCDIKKQNTSRVSSASVNQVTPHHRLCIERL